ncbi:hypothetical protein [Aliarcobacter butzleri]|uniref:Uncharacterized protein n=1 Tax=Aliarcobacter butzleri L352 TaxID=1447260 RepID=A0A837JFD5_9BACT|nr:hypothetical protein [Aliarcobacter butzleri]KLE06888.1 hypothetical protein AF77_00815 [Aliarcobacter butzleri L352]MCT7537205.1 hypothetical protein [Aliarcobacter butzleri]MCT7578861.1 hypothetical protein [Aliarcobacter butzleri]MCT7611646.1 hypothetical protein [Aliarcobacter butzleri]MCT7623731.1 hypothetical protein [Aliarcobacter butzleri]
MQISNTQTQTYSYNQSLNTTNKPDNADNSNSFNNELTNEESGKIKLIKKDIVDFIDKNNGFSSISKENEELFRSILSDDKVSNEEWKNISYEQAKELNNLITTSMIGSGGVIAINSNIFDMANISYDENFNKALYETLKNIDDDKERFLFASDVEAKLGYNYKNPFDITLNTNKIEKEIEERITRENEKYKDFENKNQILADIIQDIKNWKITDYGSFTKNLTNEYKSLSEHPLLSSESKLKYKKYSEYTTNMEINYNKAKNQTRYI